MTPMSDLVKRLRWASKMCNSDQEYEMVVTREAADHIEALEARVTGLEDALRKAELLLGIFDAHDVSSLDCDRRGGVYCDCLEEGVSSLRDALIREHRDGPFVDYNDYATEVAKLEAEVERLTESRSIICGALEREEELNADLEARVTELERENGQLRAGVRDTFTFADGYRAGANAARAALAAEKGDDRG